MARDRPLEACFDLVVDRMVEDRLPVHVTGVENGGLFGRFSYSYPVRMVRVPLESLPYIDRRMREAGKVGE